MTTTLFSKGFSEGEYVIVDDGRGEKVLGRVRSVLEGSEGDRYRVEDDAGTVRTCAQGSLKGVSLRGVRVAFTDIYLSSKVGNGRRIGYVEHTFPTGVIVEISAPDYGDREPLLMKSRWVPNGEFEIVGPWPEVTDES